MSLMAQEGINCRQLHKFGGSSLANVKSYLRVAEIIKSYSKLEDIIVVSAAGSTTNQLISLLKLSQIDRFAAYQMQQVLLCYQKELIFGLLPNKIAIRLMNYFHHDLEHIAIMLNNKMNDAVYAEVVGYGEIWSARLMTELLKQYGIEAVWIDARDFLRAERAVLPQVDEKLSYSLLQRLLIQYSGKRIVITGFISRSNSGETVLLGRNGSDYSATQIGALAGVSCITIWSHVAGVYSADPIKVKNACLLPLLRLDEASELARLAAPILHARTLQPIYNRNIDLRLRCSYNPDQGSTQIERILMPRNNKARIITSHDDICLIEFQVSTEQNIKLMYRDISLVLKHAQMFPLAVGICYERQLLQFCYTAEIADSVIKAIDKTNLSNNIRLRHGLALIAIIGAGVARNRLDCYHFCHYLKNHSVEFIWQSEDAISLVAVLRKGPTERLVQELHTSLFNVEKSINLVLFGSSNTNSLPFRVVF